MDAQDMLFNKALGTVLRKCRNEKGLTTSEVSQMIGISVKNLYFIETGTSSISAERATTLAMIYAVPLEKILVDASATVPAPDLGIACRLLRTKLKLTMKDVGELMSRSHMYIRNLEGGGNKNQEELETYMAALEDFEEFMQNESAN